MYQVFSTGFEFVDMNTANTPAWFHGRKLFGFPVVFLYVAQGGLDRV